jgi:hypothetical protein
MVYIFPEGCRIAVGGSLVDRPHLAGQGIIERIEIAANCQVTYAFEIPALDALLLEVESRHAVSIVIRSSPVEGNGQVLFAREESPLGGICFYAPCSGHYEVDIINRRSRQIDCTVHAVCPLSATSQAVAVAEGSRQAQ